MIASENGVKSPTVAGGAGTTPLEYTTFIPSDSAAVPSVPRPLRAASVSSAMIATVRPFGSFFSAFAPAAGMNVLP